MEACALSAIQIVQLAIKMTQLQTPRMPATDGMFLLVIQRQKSAIFAQFFLQKTVDGILENLVAKTATNLHSNARRLSKFRHKLFAVI
jgi:hypothetical protein